MVGPLLRRSSRQARDGELDVHQPLTFKAVVRARGLPFDLIDHIGRQAMGGMTHADRRSGRLLLRCAA